MKQAFWRGFNNGLLLIGEQLVDNARLLLVAAGSCWLYLGIAGFSRHAADIFAGAVLMAIGAYPYLRPKRKS